MNHGAEPPPGHERLQLVAVADALAEVLAVQEVAERRRAVDDLEHARPLDVAGHGDHARAGRRLGADAEVGGGVVAQQPRQVGQRLDVVDDRRLAVQADGGREERRLEAGHAAVALEALDQRRLLADHVRAGAPLHDDVDREVGAEDVLADVAGGVRLVERGGDALLGHRHLAADVEEALREAGGVAGDQAALDQLVRVELHQQPVLVGAGLALVAVDDEVAGPDALRGEAPLDAGREAGAAATEDGRRADLLVDGLGRAGQRRLEALVAVGGEEAVERVASRRSGSAT